MNRFKKILCYVEPVNQADSVLLQAIEIARSNSAQLSLICVINEILISTPNLQQNFIDISFSTCSQTGRLPFTRLLTEKFRTNDC